MSLQFFETTLFFCLLAALIMGCALSFGLLARRLLFPLALKFAQKGEYKYLSVLLEAFQAPFIYIVLLAGASLALAVLPFQSLKTPVFLALQQRVTNIGFILLFTWGFWGACSLVPRLLRHVGGRLNVETSKVFSKFLKHICQAVLLLFAVVMILDEFHYNVNGLIAGLGLGGLTVALAAKDAAANFFGGFTIVAERPFEIGDWITSGTLEGTVEDITLRSTKIRMLTNALTIVPNSQLCAAPITNWTRMKMRLAQFTLGIAYGTPRQKLSAVLFDIRAMLEAYDGVRSETVQVRLSEFSASSMDVAVQFYTFTTDMVEFRAVREEIYFQIMEIMEQNGVSFAFPTRTIYLEDMREDAMHTALETKAASRSSSDI